MLSDTVNIGQLSVDLNTKIFLKCCVRIVYYDTLYLCYFMPGSRWHLFIYHHNRRKQQRLRRCNRVFSRQYSSEVQRNRRRVLRGHYGIQFYHSMDTWLSLSERTYHNRARPGRIRPDSHFRRRSHRAFADNPGAWSQQHVRKHRS